jgi:hypothetical protein
MKLHLYGAKGGVGTTTVAAALALRLSIDGPTVLIDGRGSAATRFGDDLLAMLGSVPTAARGATPLPFGTQVAPNLFWGSWHVDATTEPRSIVVDNGCDLGAVALADDDPSTVRLLVTRNDYFSLRRYCAQPKDVTALFDGVVLVEQGGGALGPREVADVTGLPILTTIPVEPVIARANDAGVFATRLPDPIKNNVDRLIKVTRDRYPSTVA